MFQSIKEGLMKLWDYIDDSNTLVRWTLIFGSMFAVLHFGGFMTQEIRVTFLLFYYTTVATIIASFTNYVYGKVNYHKAKDNPDMIKAQAEIFYAVYLMCGLIILGTYIAQFN
jgi:hypothetical protein